MRPFFYRGHLFFDNREIKKRPRFQFYGCKVCDDERMNDLVKARKIYFKTERLCMSLSLSFLDSPPEKQIKIYCFFRTEDMFKGV